MGIKWFTQVKQILKEDEPWKWSRYGGIVRVTSLPHNVGSVWLSIIFYSNLADTLHDALIFEPNSNSNGYIICNVCE